LNSENLAKFYGRSTEAALGAILIGGDDGSFMGPASLFGLRLGEVFVLDGLKAEFESTVSERIAHGVEEESRRDLRGDAFFGAEVLDQFGGSIFPQQIVARSAMSVGMSSVPSPRE
jgi:hypothetical protein